MNSEVEERIVAMYFDNKDFEKNAKQTINTLGELKENLNLKEAAKGFEELDKAGKKLNLSQARTAIRNMGEALAGIKGNLRNALTIGSEPVHAMNGFFNQLNGYVTKVAGIDIASKIVHSFENAFRELTVAPLEAGWNMYQANVDSTKTIMSGTLKSYQEQMEKTNANWTYDEAEHMAFVKKQLDELSQYAQKTVFSLSDMTSNVGKFTNNNIPLEDSVRAMEGIANMTAKAGQGAQQASMAMYNFSQAMGVGKMTSIDWRSIENANIATGELKQLFIDTAEAAGKLTKVVSKDGAGKEMEQFFITVDKNGKKLAKKNWIEVSAENFRDSLSNGWLDKETMSRVFQIYSNQIRNVDTIMSWGFTEEQANELLKLSQAAEEAATQVRTFSKMWDALREAVQSGWADSMQLIFGDMLEATDFWTTINDKISSVLDAAAENRNNMLREWRGLTFNEQTKQWERLEGSVDGREDLIQGIYGIIDAAKDLGSAFSNAWSDVFGNLTGGKLQQITKGFRDFVDRFRGWLGSMDDANSRLSKIRKGAAGVFSILKGGIAILKAVFNVGVQIIKPFIDPLLNLFAKFGDTVNLSGAKNLGEMLTLLRDRFKDLWARINELGVSGIFVKIGDKFKELWDKIKTGVSTFLDENGLSGVKEWFIAFGDKVKEGWEAVKLAFETVKGWGVWKTLGSFFTKVWDVISGIFTPKLTGIYYDGAGRHETYGNSPFVQFFIDTWEGIKKAIEDVRGWGIWDQIGNFFSSIWDKIVSVFTPKKRYDDRGFELYNTNSPFVQFFIDTWEGIKNVFEEVKSWGIWGQIDGFFSGIWDTLVGVFTPKKRYDDRGFELNNTNSSFVQFFLDTWEGIKNVFEEVKSWGIWSQIGRFFSGVWDTIVGIFTPKKRYDDRGFELYNTNSPFVQFFLDTWEGIKDVFEEVKSWGIWQEIGGFFTGIWDSILKFFQGSGETAVAAAETAETMEEVLPENEKAPDESVSLLARIIDAIAGFVERVMAAINGVIIPPEISSFFVNLGDLFKGMFKVINTVLGFIAKLVNGNGTTSEYILTGLGVLITVFISIFDKVKTVENNKYLSQIHTESFASKFMALGVGLLAISAGLALLTTIDQDKMFKAVGALSVMGLVLGLVINQLTKKTMSSTELAKATEETPTERVFKRLISALEKVGMVAVALALLPNVIKAFGEAKKMAPELNGQDIMETLLGVATFISVVSLGLSLVDKMTAKNGLDPLAAVKTSASIVAFVTILLGGLLAVSAALDGIFGTENIVKTIEEGGQILAALGGAISGLVGGLIGGFAKGFNMIMDGRTEEEKLNDSMAILEKLGDKLEIFTSDKTSGISRILNLVGLLAQTMEDVPDAGDFTNFTKSLEPLATSIIRFGLILSGFVVEDNKDKIPLEAMKERIMALVEIMRAFDIPDLSVIVSSGKNKVDYFVQGIDKLSQEMTPERFEALASFMANLTEAFNKAMDPKGAAMSTMSGDLMKNLSGAIRIGLGEGGKYELGAFDAMPIIDAITTALGYGETAIAKAVHDMVQAGINAGGQQGVTLETPELVQEMAENDLMKTLMEQTLGGDSQADNTLSQLTAKWESMIYGNGGSKESPKEDSLMGIIGGLSTEMDGIEFPDMGEKIKSAFSFKDATTGEDMDLTAKLKETLGSFQEELNKETAFEIKIVPTFDLKNLNAESLRSMLGDYPIGMPFQFSMPKQMRIDFSGMSAELDMEGVRSRIADVTTAVNNSRIEMVRAIEVMGGKISGLESAISKMRLYLDTGALVGGITPLVDQELGRRSDWADEGAIPISMFVNPFQK